MNLRLAVQNASNKHLPLLLFPEGSLSAAQITTWLQSDQIAQYLQQFRDKSVGLLFEDNRTLATALILLDGTARRLTLLPTEQHEETLSSLIDQADIELLLTDSICPPSGRTVTAPPLPPWVGTSEESPCANRDHCQAAQSPSLTSEWVLSTSGTTNTPKFVSHTLQTLARSVKPAPPQGTQFRWGLLYQLNRFAGLQVFLQALLGGASLAIPPKDASIAEALTFFVRHEVNALSATPSLWRKLLMTSESVHLALKQVTLGGEIADQTILSALALRYPDSRIRHIYASTEAGVGFSVADGKEGFPTSFLTHPPEKVVLRISPEGILEIKPDSATQHYLANPSPLIQNDGFISTGDKVSPGIDRIYFLGRESGAINVGGNKVQPEKVERVLLAHPAIAIASVKGKKSGIIGNLVEAHLVLHPSFTNTPLLQKELRLWCAERLEPFEAPALIRIVDEIATTTTGKISRS